MGQAGVAPARRAPRPATFQYPCDIRVAVDDARRRGGVREEIVRDVVEHRIPAGSVAATWGVRVADVERWVRDAQTDAQTD